MTNEYSQSLTEVYEIIKKSNNEVRNKIPYRFKKYIYKNMDKNYNVVLDKKKSLSEQNNIHEKTKDILALIYRDYLVNSKEREKLINKELEIAKNLEEEKLKKYNTENIFKKKKPNENKYEETTSIVLEKSSILKRFINYIKNIINKGG